MQLTQTTTYSEILALLHAKRAAVEEYLAELRQDDPHIIPIDPGDLAWLETLNYCIDLNDGRVVFGPRQLTL